MICSIFCRLAELGSVGIHTMQKDAEWHMKDKHVLTAIILHETRFLKPFWRKLERRHYYQWPGNSVCLTALCRALVWSKYRGLGRTSQWGQKYNFIYLEFFFHFWVVTCSNDIEKIMQIISPLSFPVTSAKSPLILVLIIWTGNISYSS